MLLDHGSSSSSTTCDPTGRLPLSISCDLSIHDTLPNELGARLRSYLIQIGPAPKSNHTIDDITLWQASKWMLSIYSQLADTGSQLDIDSVIVGCVVEAITLNDSIKELAGGLPRMGKFCARLETMIAAATGSIQLKELINDLPDDEWLNIQQADYKRELTYLLDLIDSLRPILSVAVSPGFLHALCIHSTVAHFSGVPRTEIDSLNMSFLFEAARAFITRHSCLPHNHSGQL